MSSIRSNTRCWWTAWVSLAYLCTARTHLGLIVQPQDADVKVGDKVQFNCTTSNHAQPVKWQTIPNGKTLPIDVYLSATLINKYVIFKMDIDTETGRYNLIIPSVQMKDAGIFRCIDEAGMGEYKDATLTVSEKTDLQMAPSYAESVLSDKLQLNCSTYFTDNRVKWQHIPLEKTLPDDVFIAGNLVNKYAERCQMDKDEAAGRYNLIIMSIQLDDAGIYRCIDMDGVGEHKDAEIIVLQTAPECYSDVFTGTGNGGKVGACVTEFPATIDVNCSVAFAGNKIPVVEWMEGEENIIKGITTTNTSNNVASNLKIIVSESTVIKCQTMSSKHYCDVTIPPTCGEALITTVAAATEEVDEPSKGEQNSKAQLGYLGFLALLIIIPIIIGLYCIVKSRCRRRNTTLTRNHREETMQMTATNANKDVTTR